MNKSIFLKKIAASVLISLACFTGTGFAQQECDPGDFEQPKFHGWKKANTEHFQFFYEDAAKATAEEYALLADDAWNKITKIYSPPQDMTNVYVIARTNTVNAYTFFSPPYIAMFDTPYLEPTFTFRDDWKKLFFTHELIHIANVNFEDRNKILPKVIGSYGYTLDMTGVNGWALEGLTTVLETELTDGGRGRSPYWELEYKAPTLDNAFISYSDIGKEEEPPRGQIYVMGYLIMRSIADRWGIQALADIERNRKLLGSWEESVKLVTGHEAQEIYRDVRIALAKKYADERKIPEGQIISPRGNKNFYFKPAIVFDDGTLIALRSMPGKYAAIVKLDPSARSGSNYLSDTNPEEDLNTVFKETILTEYGFADSDSVTADENLTLYYSSFIEELDGNYGTSVDLPIFKWTKDDGAKQLTKKGSFNQPSVSRNGKVLVAVNQKGKNTRLVKIDTETGAVYSLLEDENLSFIEPCVNDDGTKVAFLVLDGKRARVAVMDLDNPGNYTIVANDDEKIYDPSYPNWQKNGNLTFCCNYRGRLEIFEIDFENSTEPKPVLADPIGATWAYKNEKGIFYCSQAASGEVIKIKPAAEWGVVPDFDGPSPAGEIIHFGQLENDYPDFVPYVVLSEVEVPEKTKEEKKAERKEKLKEKALEKTNKKKDSDSDKDDEKDEEEKPKPVEGKTVKHRPEESKQKAENANTTITTLQNEKNAILPYNPLFYIPMFELTDDKENDDIKFGIGGLFMFNAPYVYSSNGTALGEIIYYPKLNNITGTFVFTHFFGNTEIDFVANRHFIVPHVTIADGPYEYKTYNTAELGFAKPVYHKYFGNAKELDIALFSALKGGLTNTSAHLSGFNGDYTNTYSLSANFGLDSFYSKARDRGQSSSINFTLMGLGSYNFELKKPFFGIESEIGFKNYLSSLAYNLAVTGRYSPQVMTSDSFLNLFGSATSGLDDPSYPFKLVPHAGYLIPNLWGIGFDFEAYAELPMFFGKTGQSGFDKLLIAGAELAINTGRTKLAIGYHFNLDIFEDAKDFLIQDSTKFYMTVKYNWIRN